MKNICIVTSNRSDFGIQKLLISKLIKSRFNIKIIATGTHFSKQFGSTFSEIKEAKIKIFKKININKNNNNNFDTPEFISKAMSLCLKKMSDLFSNAKVDLLIILGDRFEIFATVVAAYINKIPIAHIHGGEVTKGSIDDGFRHSISKMSNIHFVANKIYKKRLIQLGEEPKNIHVVGALGVENIKSKDFLNQKELEKELKIKFMKKNLLVNFHSDNTNKNVTMLHIKRLLSALSLLKDTFLIFTYPALDLNNKIIIRFIKKFVRKNKNSIFIKSLGSLKYFSVLKIVDGMIGNSSSGIIEMPSFKKPSINVGSRQEGRIRSLTVINSKIDKKKIIASIQKLYSKKFNLKCKNSKNPYMVPNSSDRIINILKNIKLDNFNKKKFRDIKF
jgi:GDP/UDP-N,N'-diacetylbacillosamine 2-epimerase (hydrolysing)